MFRSAWRVVCLVVTVFVNGIVTVLNLILDSLHMSPQVPSRSWKLYVRLALTGAFLFAVSGFYRDYLGWNAPLMDYLQKGRLWVRGSLAFMDEHPYLINFLGAASDWLGVVLCGILVTWWVMRIPNYLPSITLCCIGIHQGRRLSSFLELSLVSALPVMIAFTLCWTGPASLFALGSALLVVWYLNIAMDETRVRTYSGRISSVHTSFFTPMAIPHRDHGLADESHDEQDTSAEDHGAEHQSDDHAADSQTAEPEPELAPR